MSWRTRIGYGLGLAAVGAGLAWGFMPRPARVDLVAAARAALAVTVREEGKTRVRDRYVVSAPVPGFAHRIELDVGDAVEPGQLIVKLEPLRSASLDPRSAAEAQARVAAAEAALQAAEQNARASASEHQLAQQELERWRRGEKVPQAEWANLADPSVITRQYDHYVLGNTALAAPDDGGMIRERREIVLTLRDIPPGDAHGVPDLDRAHIEQSGGPGRRLIGGVGHGVGGQRCPALDDHRQQTQEVVHRDRRDRLDETRADQ